MTLFQTVINVTILKTEKAQYILQCHSTKKNGLGSIFKRCYRHN